MPIHYPDILDQRVETREFSYTEKDVILYALGIGMARDPLDERELAFVYEKALKVMPTAATVLAATTRGAPLQPMPAGLKVSELNYLMMVHGEQKVVLHRPLPTSGTFTADSRVVGAYDKGKDKGALVVNETIWTDSNGDKIVTLTNTAFARGDGGFGGPSGGGPAPHIVPDRAPDNIWRFETRPDQALLYRLSGDRNPLHIEPEIARRGGFDRPILHGLCTFGITARAVLETYADYDANAIVEHEVRFSAPVLPGDLLEVSLWRDGDIVSFEASVPGRGVVAIKAGRSRLTN